MGATIPLPPCCERSEGLALGCTSWAFWRLLRRNHFRSGSLPGAWRHHNQQPATTSRPLISVAIYSVSCHHTMRALPGFASPKTTQSKNSQWWRPWRCTRFKSSKEKLDETCLALLCHRVSLSLYSSQKSSAAWRSWKLQQLPPAHSSSRSCHGSPDKIEDWIFAYLPPQCVPVCPYTCCAMPDTDIQWLIQWYSNHQQTIPCSTFWYRWYTPDLQAFGGLIQLLLQPQLQEWENGWKWSPGLPIYLVIPRLHTSVTFCPVT